MNGSRRRSVGRIADRAARGFPLLLLCFFLSGLAALIYETAWTREFSFVFGTSDLAVATVLAAYMAGLALGAALAERWAARVARPVLAYGLLELGIAICALMLPFAIAASRWLYVAIFGGVADLPDAGGLATALFDLACSFAILVTPTAMMGATLPLLARHAVRETRQIGSRVGVLYAANTAGAVVGVLLGGFVLLPGLGLRATIASAAAVNACVFVAAWKLAIGSPLSEQTAEPRGAELEAGRARWVLPLLAVSGFCSFTYEMLWVRLLGQVVGSGLHAFATMLASFLAGIAIGAAIASRIASSPRRAAVGFAAAQLGIAALSAAAFAVVNRLPALSDALQSRGYDKLWPDTAVSMATLFPTALCIGATFPCAVRMLAMRREDAGAASARAYAWNTAGSIVGSISAAFVLIPALGFEGTLTLCVGANLALAAAAALWSQPRGIALVAAAAVGAIALAVRPPATPWELLRASSIGSGANARAWGQVAYFGIGRSSTVLVVDQRQAFALRTNGLPESSVLRRGTTWHNASPVTRWLTALPVFARPEARSMLVIGFGGGMLLEVVPSSIERIDVVELEAKVIEANQAIAARRWRDPLSDPRIHVHLNDARNALLLTDQRFDAIVSQPSHPWAGGAAHLYTREFFQRVEDRLSDRGVFLQWIGLPFIDEELLRSLLASLADVFAYVSAYQPPPGGSILFLASNAPTSPLESAARFIAQSPEDAQLLGIIAPEDVVASLLLDDLGVRALAAGASPNRDGHNRLEDRSGRLGNAALDSKKLADLIAPFDPLVLRRPANADPFYLVRQIDPPERAARVAAGLASPVDRLVAEALVEIAAGKRLGPERKLREALARSPQHEAARSALLRLASNAVVHGQRLEEILAPPLSPAERVVADALRARDDPTGGQLLALDAELAAVPLRHPLGQDAARLRAIARLETGDPERIREALPIVEAALGDQPDARSLLLRAEVFAAADEHAAMLETLSTLAYRVAQKSEEQIRRAVVHRARELARKARPGDPELEWLRERVLRQYGLDPRRT